MRSKDSLFLRALEPEDIDFLYGMENREDVFPIGENRIPFSRDFLRRFVYASLSETLMSTGQLRLLACFSPDTDKKAFEMPPVGIVDFFNYEPLHRRAEIGLLLCERLRHQGLGEKILDMACGYAQNRLNLHQLYAEVATVNAASMKLFEKSGFSSCGLRRQWLMQGGKWVDVSLWQKIFE